MSGRRGSNSRPSAWEADALPTELLPLGLFGGTKITAFTGLANTWLTFCGLLCWAKRINPPCGVFIHSLPAGPLPLHNLRRGLLRVLRTLVIHLLRRYPYEDYESGTEFQILICNLTGLQASLRRKPANHTSHRLEIHNLCGRRWIRTTEVEDSRFTVCPIWPLWYSPEKLFRRYSSPLAFHSLPANPESRWRDSNPRPADYKSAALAN